MDWIKKSLFTKNYPFKGKVQIEKLDLDNFKPKNGSTTIKTDICVTYDIFSGTVDVACASGQHMPGEACNYSGGSGAAYSYNTYSPITICVPQEKVEVINYGGEGGYGSPSVTTYPYNYNPCPNRDGLCEDGSEYIPQPIVANLRWGLDLNQTQVAWLQANIVRAQEIHNYLKFTVYDDAPILEYALKHLNKMMEDPLYEAFAIDYKSENPNTVQMWWQNETWISNPDNLSLSAIPNQQYDQLNAAEKSLIKRYWLEAYLISVNAKTAKQETISKFGFNGLNDKSDAFRHAFWQAMNQRDCGQDP